MNQSTNNPIPQLHPISVLVAFVVVVVIAVVIIVAGDRLRQLPECVADKPIPSEGCIVKIKP